ncbi:MAG: class I SAM-dependent methyltransferase [Thermoplasmata archaeon]|nr:class I SAM-dependent methyltransferase [Thermoplasmata archaeon]
MRRPALWERALGYRKKWSTYSTLLDMPSGDVRAAWSEFGPGSRLFRELDRTLRSATPVAGAELGASLRGGSRLERWVTGFGPSAVNRELYALVRSARPDRVVETGVASGISTAIILEALECNGKGQLWSIDLPNYDPSGYLNSDGKREAVRVPVGREPGWVVPPRLRPRWTLLLGRSSELLASLLSQLGSIEMFFHDSEHSELTMRFEFETAWGALAPGGLLYSDDVIWNSAFDEFSDSVGAKPALTPAGRGALRKPASVPDVPHSGARKT